MAYVIGNTTVITNNGALGSIDGNSLNLANNSNIAGGGSATSVISSTNNSVAVPGTPLGMAIMSGGGNSGGSSQNNFAFGTGGTGGYQSFGAFDLSPGGNSAFSIGGAGGNSSFNYPSGANISPSVADTSLSGFGGYRIPGQGHPNGRAGGSFFANFRNARQNGALGAGGGATRFAPQQGGAGGGGSGAGILIGF